MRRFLDFMLSFGAFPGESEAQGSRRRIIVAAFWLATFLTIPTLLGYFASGYFWVGVANVLVVVLAPVFLLILDRVPQRFSVVVNAMFATVYVLVLFETTMFGGLLESGLTPLFTLIIFTGAVIALGTRAAILWFGTDHPFPQLRLMISVGWRL